MSRTINWIGTVDIQLDFYNSFIIVTFLKQIRLFEAQQVWINSETEKSIAFTERKQWVKREKRHRSGSSFYDIKGKIFFLRALNTNKSFCYKFKSSYYHYILLVIICIISLVKTIKYVAKYLTNQLCFIQYFSFWESVL